jgi:hypothetical protein
MIYLLKFRFLVFKCLEFGQFIDCRLMMVNNDDF